MTHRLVLITILVAALALRLTGIDWDAGRFFHPDERAIVQFILPSIGPLWPPDLRLVLDAARSPWNPHWFNYGSFPLYLLRAMQQGAITLDPAFTLDGMRFLGRGLSAVADTGSVLLVYLIGARLYGWRTGLLAALFAALAVIHIQLSHFATFDAQLTFWVMLAVYAAARTIDGPRALWSVLGGVALGLALATKISVLPLAVPLAAGHFLPALVGARSPRPGPGDPAPTTGALARGLRLFALCLATAAAVVVIAQPYALLDWSTFLRHTQEQTAMALRAADLPYTRQYEGTAPYLYQVQQLATWGLGLPLGIVAWLGLVAAGWRAWRTRSRADILLLSWVIPYFLLTGGFPVKFLRYMLPITPVLLVLGAHWLVSLPRARRLTIGVAVSATALYALAFMSVYRGDHPAIAMSRWINQNAQPGALVLKEHWEEGVPGLERYPSQELRLYEPDTPAKLSEMAGQLEKADYILLFSNRLYGTIPRLPARYPMSTEYYRLLFSGELGYELAHVEERHPGLLGVNLPEQTFERPGLPNPTGEQRSSWLFPQPDESFTAYDHPEVVLFKRVRPMPAAEVVAKLQPALTPVSGAGSPLMLSQTDLEAQQAGGTWTEMFPEGSPGDRAPVLVWLIAIELAGLLAFPLAHGLFRAFPDRGYLPAKMLGLLLLAYPVWLAASLHLAPFTSTTIAAAFVLLAVVSASVAWCTRAALGKTLRHRWRYLLTLEGLFLAAFAIFLLIRAANPDLWHPARGGEKPMDLAFLNAIVKSTYMPPYDPWFSGGYINYYYFGQFIVATLVKLTGVVPYVAYNLAVPTLWALFAGTAFSAGTALVARLPHPVVARSGGGRERVVGDGAIWGGGNDRARPQRLTDAIPRSMPPPSIRRLLAAGATTTLGVAILGNLDGAAQVLETIRRAGTLDVRSTLPGVAGLVEVAAGEIRGPFGGAAAAAFDYWRSRGMGGMDPSFIDPVLKAPSISIVEFPLFTFLFADLHAHLIALPLTLLAVALALEAGLSARPGMLRRIAFLGALGFVLGAVRWTNSWDFPTYLALTASALLLAELTRPGARLRGAAGRAASQAALVFFFSALFFRPFQDAYRLFFSGGLLPSPEATPPGIYLRIHGLFLFILAAFVAFELNDRFGRLSVFRVPALFMRCRYHPKRAWRLYRTLVHAADPMAQTVTGAGLLSLGLVAALAEMGAATAGFLLILLALLAVLGVTELRQPSRRGRAYLLALVLAGGAAAVSLLVETVKFDIPGEIQRMNNVFKLYLQVWVFYALAAGYALWWLVERARARRGMRVWLAGAGVLAVAAAVYPLLATPVRVADRFNAGPLSLDGEAYMQAAVQREQEKPVELVWDLDAITWLQRNVKGSPVVLEASTPIYRWGSRISINTGLPTVLGWDWHESQQRWDYRAAVETRKQDVAALYSDADIRRTEDLLGRYGVRYVYVGELERVFYPDAGIRKFDQMAAAGRLRVVYENPKVKIYEVLS